MIVVRWLAWPTAVVNATAMLLAAYDGDMGVFLVGLFGASLAMYAWLYYLEELRTMSGNTGYRALAMRLRWEIKEESRGAGERLASVVELCHRFGVARVTVMRALDLLEAEGLIRRERGRGTYIVGPDGWLGVRSDYPGVRLENALRDRIAEVPAGTPMAFTQQLMENFGCSYQTVRRVQAKLTADGLLRRTRSGGYVKR